VPPASSPAPDLPASVARNIVAWTGNNREYTDAAAARSWAAEHITWGVFGVPDEAIGSPLGDVAGQDVVELGCGTAYVSAWLARRGARPVGVDPTPAQLMTARRMQDQTGIRFPLIEAPGERVPLPDASFDLAISEYGASLWADPERWIPEAARLLRPDGRLVFLTTSLIAQLCEPETGPVGRTLVRPLRGLHHIEWPGDDGTEYGLSHGDWLRLLRRHGFQVLDLIELYAPPDAAAHVHYDHVTPEWAAQWPAEELWVAQLRVAAPG
jgi:SAM-dependent methyltransferase